MALLGPASTIFFIDKDNSEYYDESMSAASDMLVGRIAGEMGPMYLGKIGIPSLLSKNTTASPHSHNPVEQDANIKAFNYFKQYYSADFDVYNPDTGEYSGQWKWKDNQNPILCVDWHSYKSSYIENQNALSNNQLTLTWCDGLFYVPVLGFLLQGIASTVVNYFKY